MQRIPYTRFVNNNLDGHIVALFIIVIAAAEAAVGLGIVIRFFQIKESIHIQIGLGMARECCCQKQEVVFTKREIHGCMIFSFVQQGWKNAVERSTTVL